MDEMSNFLLECVMFPTMMAMGLILALGFWLVVGYYVYTFIQFMRNS